jgi:hypothetical protein
MKLALASLLAAALFFAGCARRPPDLYWFVPPGTTILAGADLDAVRASPVYSKLPPTVQAAVEPFQEAHYLLFAYNGKELLAILRGPFRKPPSDATLVGSDVALAGSPDVIRAAIAQEKLAKPGNPGLAAHASKSAIWVAIQGGTALPLTGNAANLDRLLRDARYASITLQPGNPIDVAAIVEATTPQAAMDVEQTLRAVITLTAAADRRQAALLHSIRITRDDRTVHASVSAPPEALSMW